MSVFYEEKINSDSVKCKLCKNTSCQRFPPDWNPEKHTEENYEEDEWKKCCLCDGYFHDNGLDDILFVQEEPNNQKAQCDLCGKTTNIVQMKDTGEYICANACDESEEEEEEEEEESEDEINKCDQCNIELDSIRDGSTDKNFRCNNCYWEDTEGKYSENIIKPDYRVNEEKGDRYVICDNCNESIDCWNSNIYCLFKENPKDEITICQLCNDDLREEFEEEGYDCDDWDET